MVIVKINENPFTGKIIYPVVTQIDRRVEVSFRGGEREQKSDDEDVSLDIEAHERKNRSYDIRFCGKLVANTPEYKLAEEKMTDYINLETGKLKEKGLESAVA